MQSRIASSFWSVNHGRISWFSPTLESRRGGGWATSLKRLVGEDGMGLEMLWVWWREGLGCDELDRRGVGEREREREREREEGFFRMREAGVGVSMCCW